MMALGFFVASSGLLGRPLEGPSLVCGRGGRRRPRAGCSRSLILNLGDSEIQQWGVVRAQVGLIVDLQQDDSIGVDATTTMPLKECQEEDRSEMLGVLKRFALGADILGAMEKWREMDGVVKLDPKQVEEVLSMFAGFGLSGTLLGTVIKRRPDLLAKGELMRATAELLGKVGVTEKDIKSILLKWPGSLAVGAQRLRRPLDFLCREDVGFQREDLRALVRRAPWVLLYDEERDMQPLVGMLSGRMNSQCLRRIIRSTPHIFGTPRAFILAVLEFLQDYIGLEPDQVTAVVQSCPSLLTSSIKRRLLPASRYLRSLAISKEKLKTIVRAFPAVLLLDVKTEMKNSVEFFQKRGLVSVGRIVTRLPSLLSYDVQHDLEPKMEYLEKRLGLTVFDVLGFPAYFNYSLEKRIIPRTAFLQTTGKRVADIGLSRILAPVERVFCRRIARVPHSQYVRFSQTLQTRLEGSGWYRYSSQISVDCPERAKISISDKYVSHTRKVLAHKKRRRTKRHNRVVQGYIPWQEIA